VWGLRPRGGAARARPRPHGGPRTFHQKSTCLNAINFKALRGANLVTLPPKFGVIETVPSVADVEGVGVEAEGWRGADAPFFLVLCFLLRCLLLLRVQIVSDLCYILLGDIVQIVGCKVQGEGTDCRV
jgi:hypothetical protein